MARRDRLGAMAPYVILFIGLAVIATFSGVLAYSNGYEDAYTQHRAEKAAAVQNAEAKAMCKSLPLAKGGIECAATTD